jgi:hypothetical protein
LGGGTSIRLRIGPKKAAAFREVDERVQPASLRFPGTAADYLRWFREVAIPMDFVWERLGPDESERIIAEIVANMAEFAEGGTLGLDLEVVVGSGVQ